MLPIKPRMLVKARTFNTAPAIKVSPSCRDCKWSKDKICILFKVIYFKLIRKSIDLCGPDGFYFKPK